LGASINATYHKTTKDDANATVRLIAKLPHESLSKIRCCLALAWDAQSVFNAVLLNSSQLACGMVYSKRDNYKGFRRFLALNGGKFTSAHDTS
jgi:hypothetical protein